MDGRSSRCFKGSFTEYKDKIGRIGRIGSRAYSSFGDSSVEKKIPTLVRILIKIPDSINDEQKDALKALQTV